MSQSVDLSKDISVGYNVFFLRIILVVLTVLHFARSLRRGRAISDEYRIVLLWSLGTRTACQQKKLFHTFDLG